MASETYAAARARLLRELAARGWTTRAGLKVPWAEMPGGHHKLWFKAQAVYLDAHSLWIDIRGMSVDALIVDVHRTLQIRITRGLAGDRRRRFGNAPPAMDVIIERMGTGFWVGFSDPRRMGVRTGTYAEAVQYAKAAAMGGRRVIDKTGISGGVRYGSARRIGRR